jgi:hypothetical protein
MEQKVCGESDIIEGIMIRVTLRKMDEITPECTESLSCRYAEAEI